MQAPVGARPQVTFTPSADFEMMSNQTFDCITKNVIATSTFTIELKEDTQNGPHVRKFHYIILPENIETIRDPKGKLINVAIIKEITPKNFEDKGILKTRKLAYILSENGRQKLYCDPEEEKRLQSVALIVIESANRRHIYCLRDPLKDRYGLRLDSEQIDKIKKTYSEGLRLYNDLKAMKSRPATTKS